MTPDMMLIVKPWSLSVLTVKPCSLSVLIVKPCSLSVLQLIPLCAHLTVPVLQLSPHSLDFGTCYVGQTRVQEVFLSNTGGSNSYWTALIDHGETPGVFAVSPDSGTLDAHIVHISASRVALQISFTAGDSTEYKAMLTVHGMLGERMVRLEVRGRGSHDERFESLLTDTC
ncbi:Deleted in lung and esophageal cancer protein 1 [Acipenser ruthenus]|uniref:Deleted in lung and esophageal cancer protein 1 n=1 Tax=Acipenser ruthenus TaxID=7906 RepID=A0A662YT90_ACIRT|nr:Deleted in lung and esophageal cancer protein 1 [Acipenser ruthenus]